ncbi:DMT family transporter [Psychrobacillus lasiicapitis]|uniref:DMT family transporter n=1 Tax=Psychrobacillus lasiicapitis TaxID=1636719 RepID=A0A544TBT4_9BACI|nr:DMT family transporter [Psychrobacillus lasiicapitis]TQR14917.1 DMT family transporter [Psychrobacillus lasiicapitis]GGA21031.1 membrane protein [Psychrobacillus lasiicapitis]
MKEWKIYAMLVFVMFVWGANLPILKYLVTVVPPVSLTAIRILSASLAVFIILWKMKLLRKPTKQEWKYILLGSLTNVVLHHYFLNIGLSITSGTHGGLILGTGPMLTAISAAIILKYFPTKFQWLGLVFGLAGVSVSILVGGGESNGANIGDFYVFLAILAQVLSYMVVSKAAATLDPRLLTAYMMMIGAVVLVIISLIQEPGGIAVFAETTPTFWVLFLTSAIICTAVGHMMYNYAVGKAGATKSAIFMNLNPLFSLILSAIFLGEILTGRHFIGLFLIIIGVMLGSGAAEDMWKKYRGKRAAS